MQNAIEAKGLTKSFKQVAALRGIDLTFEQNRIYGLLGRNGAGKSTLLNLICNRLFASGGSITIDGLAAQENDAAQSKVYLMAEKSLMPEDARVKTLFKTTAAFYNFNFAYAERLAADFGLDVNKKLKALSTGYATIAKLIAALCTDADYLLLDEPVLGLDANHRERFYNELLKNYAERPRAVVLSTHLIEEISPIIEHVVILHAGAILMDTSAEQAKGMGYTVTGKSEDVDAYCAGRNVLSADVLGGLKTAALLGEATELPTSLQKTPLDLQKLFVHLTNQYEVRS